MSTPSGEGGADPGAVRRVLVDIDLPSVLTFAAVAAIAATGWAVFTSAPDMVTRVAVGLLLGIALSPLVAGVQRRWRTSRGVAAATVGGALMLFFAAVVLLVAPAAVDQARTFSRELPATVRDLYSWPVIGARLERSDAAGDVADLIDRLPARLDDATLTELGERLLGGFVSTVVVMITALGVLVDGERVVRRVRSVVPPAHRARAAEVGEIVYQTFGSYFAGSLLVAALNGLVVLTVGLLLGVPLAPIAGLWSMLTNFIPQIGGFLGGSFFIVLALTKSPLTAVIAAAVFLGYQQLENNVIGPAIVGSAVNLTPPATMLAALVGGAAAGVPGALVATPLVGAAKALYLERRGELPVRREATLRRQIRRRMERVKERVTDITEEITGD
jgi:predicted PurR-regulated permease PerM